MGGSVGEMSNIELAFPSSDTDPERLGKRSKCELIKRASVEDESLAVE